MMKQDRFGDDTRRGINLWNFNRTVDCNWWRWIRSLFHDLLSQWHESACRSLQFDLQEVASFVTNRPIGHSARENGELTVERRQSIRYCFRCDQCDVVGSAGHICGGHIVVARGSMGWHFWHADRFHRCAATE